MSLVVEAAAMEMQWVVAVARIGETDVELTKKEI